VQHVCVVLVHLSVDLRIDRFRCLSVEVLFVLSWRGVSVLVHSDSVIEHLGESSGALASWVRIGLSVEQESPFFSNLEPHSLHLRPSTKAT